MFKYLFTLLAGLSFGVQHLDAAAIGTKTLLDTPELRIVDYSNEVKRQNAPDCGYHSVKNAFALSSYLKGRINRNKLLEELKKEPTGPMATMPETREGVTGTTEAACITDDQVRWFAELFGFAPSDIIVLPNLQQVMLSQEDNIKIARTIEAINAGNPIVRPFVLGTMREFVSTKGHQGTTGHYIGVVLHRTTANEPISFAIADSAGQNDNNINLVLKLNEQLQQNPDTLKYQGINTLLQEAGTNIANDNAEAALANIEELIDDAKTYKLFDTTFNARYADTIISLLQTIEPFVENERIQALRNRLFEYVDPNSITTTIADTKTSISLTETVKQGNIDHLMQELDNISADEATRLLQLIAQLNKSSFNTSIHPLMAEMLIAKNAHINSIASNNKPVLVNAIERSNDQLLSLFFKHQAILPAGFRQAYNYAKTHPNEAIGDLKKVYKEIQQNILSRRK